MAAPTDMVMDVDRPNPRLNGGSPRNYLQNGSPGSPYNGSPRSMHNGSPRRMGLDFVTLGMFIIDEIHFPPPQPAVQNIPGGAGSFSALGARIFSSPPVLSRAVGWIVDCGSDFPPALRHYLTEWETYCLMRETPDRLTTRGLNEYGEHDFRAFRYLTPKRRLEFTDLMPEMLLSKSFHLICSPSRCIEQVEGILRRRSRELGVDVSKRPLFIWEPVPDLCTPSQLDVARQALRNVEVVSPNHMELCAFFGISGSLPDSGAVDRNMVERCADEWLSSGIGVEDGPGAIVVRAGREGCYIATRKQSCWLPAYHQSPEKVKDPTGGGNTFLGGLAVALARDKSLVEAAIWGTVAASFAIEQIGMPIRTVGQDGKERWNGDRVAERLELYLQRL
ncbi:uncharacterized protein PV09_00662 [Verruconis gallopava]|uniref:Carbohydrate kinase PfkB domain-containing protein n=1 Tax=Verruconis gallopava TaxID=253628 RepID=A0A0D2BBJ4_9PEZI|nr:uncharacterized protein PV09_00662 [Verruconis gallopava]KIW08719.1 hypothetical protein PV09_00662 [Verruconis gallopava]